MNYKLVYAASFHDSLEKIVKQWAKYGIPAARIKRYVHTIFGAVSTLKTFPNRYQDVNELYHLQMPTRRIHIGKEYAIFCRVFPNQETIHIGKIFGLKQDKMTF
jgi:plasmid stabilization system protein ParE